MSRLVFSQLLLLIEAIAIVALYQVFSNFECRQTDLFLLCRGIRLGMVLGLCLAAGFALLLFFQPSLRDGLLKKSATASGSSRRWGVLHLAGLALIAAPTLILSQGQLVDFAPFFLLAVAGGGIAALTGAALWLMPAASWRDLCAHDEGRPAYGAVLADCVARCTGPKLCSERGSHQRADLDWGLCLS